jgi:hypothetical protein
MHQSSSDLGEIFSAHFTVWKLFMLHASCFCCMKINQIKYILKELEKTKRSGPSPAFQLNLFRNGDCYKMGYGSRSLWSGRGSLGALHALETSKAIVSHLLHINEPNRVDSERTKKDKEVGPFPSLLARFS